MQTNINKRIVSQLINEIEAIVEAEDDQFLEGLDDRYGWLIDEADTKELIDSFERNFSISSMNEVDFLPETLNGLEISHLSWGKQIMMVLESLEFSKKEIKQLLIDSLDRVVEADYYNKCNEIFSCSVGETEHQIDVDDHSELKELIGRASDDELRAAGISDSDRESFLVYGNPCERVVWLVDSEIICEKVQALINERKLK